MYTRLLHKLSSWWLQEISECGKNTRPGRPQEAGDHALFANLPHREQVRLLSSGYCFPNMTTHNDLARQFSYNVHASYIIVILEISSTPSDPKVALKHQRSKDTSHTYYKSFTLEHFLVSVSLRDFVVIEIFVLLYFPTDRKVEFSISLNCPNFPSPSHLHIVLGTCNNN